MNPDGKPVALTLSFRPGVGALGTVSFPGSPTMVAIDFYLFGDQAAMIVARDTPRWDAWFQERFPMPTALAESE